MLPALRYWPIVAVLVWVVHSIERPTHLRAEEIVNGNLVIVTDLPTLRFEQTTSLGNPAQIWDLSGTDTTITIADVTSGTTPFVLNPTRTAINASVDTFIQTAGPNSEALIIGASTTFDTKLSSLVVNNDFSYSATIKPAARFEVSDDSVGRLDFSQYNIGTDYQPLPLWVPRIQGRSAVANTGLVLQGMIATDTGAVPCTYFTATKSSGGGPDVRPIAVFRNNDVDKVTFSAAGAVIATAYNPVSSRLFKDQIAALDPRMAKAALRGLTPVEFVYKDDPTEPRVGFIAEDVPDVVANPDRTSVPIMDVVAIVATVVKDHQLAIQRQSQAIEQEQSQSDSLSKTIEQNEKLIRKQQDALADLKQAAARRKRQIDQLKQRLMSLERELGNSP